MNCELQQNLHVEFNINDTISGWPIVCILYLNDAYQIDGHRFVVEHRSTLTCFVPNKVFEYFFVIRIGSELIIYFALVQLSLKPVVTK